MMRIYVALIVGRLRVLVYKETIYCVTSHTASRSDSGLVLHK